MPKTIKNRNGNATIKRYKTYTMARDLWHQKWFRSIVNEADLLKEMKNTGCVFESEDQLKAYVKRLRANQTPSKVQFEGEIKVYPFEIDYTEVLKQYQEWFKQTNNL